MDKGFYFFLHHTTAPHTGLGGLQVIDLDDPFRSDKGFLSHTHTHTHTKSKIESFFNEVGNQEACHKVKLDSHCYSQPAKPKACYTYNDDALSAIELVIRYCRRHLLTC